MKFVLYGNLVLLSSIWGSTSVSINTINNNKCIMNNISHLPTLKFIGTTIYKLNYIKKNDYEILQLYFMKNIKKKYLNYGWSRSFKKNIIKYTPSIKKSITWIKNNTVNGVKNKCLLIYKKKEEVIFFYNNKIIAQIKNLEISKIIFLPWLGKHPVNKKLKQQLLNQN